jgi:uncharacterized protein YjbI with pentapeptide repeats
MKSSKRFRSRLTYPQQAAGDLHSQVRDSSEKNRQLFFVWIALNIYTAITAVSTTDLQLLIPRSTISLPILSVNLPIIGFFLLTPWLILAMQFTLMQNIEAHARKLYAWTSASTPQTTENSIPAFLFDAAALDNESSPRRLTVVAADLTFYVLGPATIALLIWRFGDYQEIGYSLTQSSALFLALHLGIRIKRGILTATKGSIGTLAFQVSCYVVIFLAVSTLLCLIAILNHSNSYPGWINKNVRQFSTLLKPSIEVKKGVQLFDIPSSSAERMAFDGERDLRAWLSKNVVHTDLQRRQLKLADLRDSDLRMADLSWSQLQGSLMGESRLEGANLWRANLQDAFLGGAKLTNAQLGFTDLKNAYLWEANLREADFWGADLTGTNLRKADLVGAKFKETILDAYLVEANISRAKFERAKLQGAWLIDVKLDGETEFRGCTTNLETLVLASDGSWFDSFDQFVVDIKKSFALRNQLRSNGLELPALASLDCIAE